MRWDDPSVNLKWQCSKRCHYSRISASSLWSRWRIPTNRDNRCLFKHTYRSTLFLVAGIILFSSLFCMYYVATSLGIEDRDSTTRMLLSAVHLLHTVIYRVQVTEFEIYLLFLIRIIVCMNLSCYHLLLVPPGTAKNEMGRTHSLHFLCL